MPASSRPIAVLMPFFSKWFSAATPERRRKLDEQLWQTQPLASARRSMSFSFSHTPWPSVSRSFTMPKRSMYSSAVQSPRRLAYSFW